MSQTPPSTAPSPSSRWYQVSLRLHGDHLPVDSVGALLDLPTSFRGIKGEPRRTNPRLLYSTSFWGWSCTRDTSVAFEIQLGEALEKLETRRSAVDELLALPGVEGEFFLGYGAESGQGSVQFSAGLLSRIAALGLELSIDLYPPWGIGAVLDFASRSDAGALVETEAHEGVPVFVGSQVPVAKLLEYLAEGRVLAEFAEDFPLLREQARELLSLLARTLAEPQA